MECPGGIGVGQSRAWGGGCAVAHALDRRELVRTGMAPARAELAGVCVWWLPLLPRRRVLLLLSIISSARSAPPLPLPHPMTAALSGADRRDQAMVHLSTRGFADWTRPRSAAPSCGGLGQFLRLCSRCGAPSRRRRGRRGRRWGGGDAGMPAAAGGTLLFAGLLGTPDCQHRGGCRWCA